MTQATNNEYFCGSVWQLVVPDGSYILVETQITSDQVHILVGEHWMGKEYKTFVKIRYSVCILIFKKELTIFTKKYLEESINDLIDE